MEIHIFISKDENTPAFTNLKDGSNLPKGNWEYKESRLLNENDSASLMETLNASLALSGYAETENEVISGINSHGYYLSLVPLR